MSNDTNKCRTYDSLLLQSNTPKNLNEDSGVVICLTLIPIN